MRGRPGRAAVEEAALQTAETAALLRMVLDRHRGDVDLGPYLQQHSRSAGSWFAKWYGEQYKRNSDALYSDSLLRLSAPLGTVIRALSVLYIAELAGDQEAHHRWRLEPCLTHAAVGHAGPVSLFTHTARERWRQRTAAGFDPDQARSAANLLVDRLAIDQLTPRGESPWAGTVEEDGVGQLLPWAQARVAITLAEARSVKGVLSVLTDRSIGICTNRAIGRPTPRGAFPEVDVHVTNGRSVVSVSPLHSAGRPTPRQLPGMSDPRFSWPPQIPASAVAEVSHPTGGQPGQRR